MNEEILKAIEHSWRYSILSNGIKVVHLPTKGDHRLFLSTVFAVGSRDEKFDQVGISHFLEHMMFRGSQNYPSFLQLADAFEWLGGHWNAETGQEHTEYSYEGISSGRSEALRLFADFLGSPKLLDIELEREVILRELEDELNEFGNSTDLCWHVANLIWPKSGLGNPIAGSLASIQNISEQDLLTHRQNFYTTDRMAICIAGGNDSDQVFSDLEGAFKGYPIAANHKPAGNEHVDLFKGPKFRFVNNSDNQYQISLAFLCEGEWSDKVVGYEMICRILSDSFSSRLSLRLREELGLVYDIVCEEGLSTDCGTITIEAQMTPDKVHTVLKEICKILVNFRNHGPTKDELRKAIFRAEVRLSLAAYEPEQLSFRLGWNFLHGKESSLLNRLKQIRRQETQSVMDLANQVFQASNCALVLMGPKNSSLEEKVQDTLRKYL